MTVVVDLAGDLSRSVAYAAASWLWTNAGAARRPPSSAAGRSCLAASTVAAHCSAATANSKQRKTKTDADVVVVRAAADSIALHAPKQCN
ncbi:hypothetical protein OsI_07989 [Oryza sativa Indica Group]|jgi:hypothetical protein|uniref:Uncharacterized protein n=6 Tax=Oryza TaxID=4527 RepID=A0A0D3F7D1_9ORYZ|nr:hypothetical protein OsI_07989 [Oryza sativa Indica Group]